MFFCDFGMSEIICWRRCKDFKIYFCYMDGKFCVVWKEKCELWIGVDVVRRIVRCRLYYVDGDKWCLICILGLGRGWFRSCEWEC